LAAAIERLRDARVRERFGAAGHRRWLERFTLAASMRATQAIHRTALVRCPARTIE
jgi:hypothetical protein